MPNRMLIVGVGSIGERHLRCFRNTGRVDKLGLCEVKDPLRREIAERYQISDTYRNLGEALSDAVWDSAVIAAPAHLHIVLARQLAEAGMAMLVEKPLSSSTDGVDELLAMVRQKNLVACTAYVFRNHPELAGMRQILQSGRLGRPLSLIHVSGQNFPFYRPAYLETYYTDRATGGGAIQDALTHAVNAGEWLLGPIDRVCADAQHMALPGVTVEDTVNVLARHGSTMACYSLNQFQTPSQFTFSVHCESGSVEYSRSDNRLRWINQTDGPWHEEPIASFSDRDDYFVAQAHAFLDAFEGKGPLLCTLEEGLQTLHVNLAVMESALETGGWVDVPVVEAAKIAS